MLSKLSPDGEITGSVAKQHGSKTGTTWEQHGKNTGKDGTTQIHPDSAMTRCGESTSWRENPHRGQRSSARHRPIGRLRQRRDGATKVRTPGIFTVIVLRWVKIPKEI